MVGRDDHPERPEGFVLFVVLIAILLILSAGALVAIHLQGRHLLVTDQVRNVHVRALVDSGIAHGLAKIYEDNGYSGGERLELDGGEVFVSVSFATADRFWIDAWARYRGEVRGMRVQVLAEDQGDYPRVLEWGDVPPGRSPFDVVAVEDVNFYEIDE